MATEATILHDGLQGQMERLGRDARAAAQELALAAPEAKAKALTAMAEALRARQDAILEANAQDMVGGRAKGAISTTKNETWLPATSNYGPPRHRSTHRLLAGPDPHRCRRALRRAAAMTHRQIMKNATLLPGITPTGAELGRAGLTELYRNLAKARGEYGGEDCGADEGFSDEELERMAGRGGEEVEGDRP